MANTAIAPLPATGVIRVADLGIPHIEGFRCGACNAAFTEQTLACRACGEPVPPAPFRAGETGKLWTWSIVRRSYPGIDVPFVSAIVDLDDGLTVKGTLRDVDHDALTQGMPVRLVYDDAGGATDKDGTPYIGFHFVPAGRHQ